MPIKMFGAQYSGSVLQPTTMRAEEQAMVVNPQVRSLLSVNRVIGTLPTPPVQGFTMWIDASDINTITRVGTAVTAISDKTGNNRGFTGTATYVPNAKNNWSVLQLTAGTHTMQNGNCNFSASTLTMFSVTRMVNAGSNGRVIQGLNNNWLHGFWSGQHARFYFGNWVVQETNADFNWYVHSSWCTAAGAAHVWENGVDKGSGGSGFGGPNNLAINTGGFPSETTNNQIAEIIIYPVQLSDADRVLVENYLRTKWNV